MPYKDRVKQLERNKRYYLEHREEIKDAAKRYYYKNKQNCLENVHKYYNLHKEERNLRGKMWRENHKEKQKEYHKQYAKSHRPLFNKLARESYNRAKLSVLSYYSNQAMRCACCGESELGFLTIDHINGGGNKHLKELGAKTLYRHLVQENFPTGYQVLCYNCNCGRGHNNGICPHKKGGPR